MPKPKYSSFFSQKKERPELNELSVALRTQTRDRTGMDFTPLVFETSASTNSAIWALALRNWLLRLQRYG